MPAFDEGGHMGGSDQLVMRFAPEAESRVREEFAPETMEREADGSWLVTLACDIGERTRSYLLSFGPLLEVLEPADVRAWLRDRAQAVVQRYAEDEPDADPGAGA